MSIFVYLFEAQIRLILFTEDKNVNIMQNTEFLNSGLTEYSILVIIKNCVRSLSIRKQTSAMNGK